MKKEIEAFVNAANEQELEAAWNNLSAEEQRVFEQLMEEEPPEDALAFFAQLYDDAPKEQTSETVNISENEIYFKRKPLTEEQKKHSSYVDENGNLHVKNLSAFWIPELTTTEKVGHTTYTVTGSVYVGIYTNCLIIFIFIELAQNVLYHLTKIRSIACFQDKSVSVAIIYHFKCAWCRT